MTEADLENQQLTEADLENLLLTEAVLTSTNVLEGNRKLAEHIFDAFSHVGMKPLTELPIININYISPMLKQHMTHLLIDITYLTRRIHSDVVFVGTNFVLNLLAGTLKETKTHITTRTYFLHI